MQVNDPIYGKLAAIPFARLVDRFGSENSIVMYVSKFARVVLGMLLRSVKAEKRKEKHRLARENENGKKETKQDWDPTFIRSVLVTNALSSVLGSTHAAMNSVVFAEVKKATEEYHKLYGLSHPGLTSLLLLEHEETLNKVAKLFDEMDMRKKGILTKRDVITLASGRNPLTSKLQLLFAELDRNQDGLMSKRECLNGLIRSPSVKKLAADVRKIVHVYMHANPFARFDLLHKGDFATNNNVTDGPNA